ncbi:hypothetical protein A2V82_08200 [candidate division KSB1 bacterium RBG_16_48_16]|nr:MAG: hypothetical protein A2V82_08200 [candidate division KSB1 bacterium RBG_16_48_16]
MKILSFLHDDFKKTRPKIDLPAKKSVYGNLKYKAVPFAATFNPKFKLMLPSIPPLQIDLNSLVVSLSARFVFFCCIKFQILDTFKVFSIQCQKLQTMRDCSCSNKNIL